MASLEATHLFTLRVDLDMAAVSEIGPGPQGARTIVPVSGGTFEGERLRGTISGSAGGDWLTARPDGSFKLDVRATIVTDDGASILVTYNGIGVANEDGTSDLRTAPLFETGDERYEWLNRVQAVGLGRLDENGLVYEVYALD